MSPVVSAAVLLCELTGGPFAAPEAAALGAVHDELHHGGTVTALVVAP